MTNGSHASIAALFAPEPTDSMEDWKRYLAGARPTMASPRDQLQLLDLFSGVGGLALGFCRVAEQLELEAVSHGAVDTDSGALEVYQRNLGTLQPINASVASLVDFQVRGEGESARFLYAPELIGRAQGAFAGKADVVLAGPPCQGHSSLNNKSRGDDPRNRLYLTVPAVAVATGATTVIIENVPGVVRARGNVVQTAIRLLGDAGFAVTTALLSADSLGWPQTRKRFFLVASRGVEPVPLAEITAELRREPLPVSWAIDDLIDADANDPMHSVAELSPENAERVAWLFANDAYDMPNHMRPDCHKEGTSYNAVYGRMWWDQPAPTLTTGFLTPGRGRFIHPKRPRTLTPREAARLQGFPDWFDFRGAEGVYLSRRQLTTWIGNAVPTILGYAAGLSALGGASVLPAKQEAA